MRRKFLFVIITITMLFAVQGYAQRENGSRRSDRRETPRVAERNFSRQSSRSDYHQSRQRNDSYRQQPMPRQRNDSYRQPPSGRNGYHPPRHHGYHQPPPPPRHWQPQYRHHHQYHHHSHLCQFSDWYWYSWGGYRNRFICHRQYVNRYFDSMLGYYLWGTLNEPTRLDIGNMSFTRYGNTLKVQTGYDCVYMNVYDYREIRYHVEYTTVKVSTGHGYATICFYDEYGNEAIYRL